MASRLALLVACALAACVDGRASFGRFADEGPPVPPPSAPTAGVGGVGPAGSPAGSSAQPAQPATPDAGHRFDPAPPPSAPADAGSIQAPEPEAPNLCVAGRYRGDFGCGLRMPPPGGGGPPPPMLATLPFGLELSSDGSVASIVDGDFMFSAWGLDFMGRFEGLLDCTTGRFSATIADGVVSPAGPGAFFGALEGSVIDTSGTLEGTWWHGPMPGEGCTGAWRALRQAP